MTIAENSIPAAQTASGIELTPAGVAYCEAQAALSRRTRIVKTLHAALDVVDECIAILDGMDGDCDLEPYLAGLDGSDGDDREGDLDAFECDGDPDAENIGDDEPEHDSSPDYPEDPSKAQVLS